MQTQKTRKLGNTGLELSALGLGSWGLFAESYGPVFPEQQTTTLARALEQGVTTFDMAPTWGDDGSSERAVALAVGALRPQMTYITRVGIAPGPDGPVAAFAPHELRAQCEASLGRLATDHIDVLLLAHPTVDVLRNDEVAATMQALVSEGKVRAWGASVSHADDARAAIVVGAQVLCVPFNMLQPGLVWDLASECKERGVGLLARSVLLHGLLGGRWSPQKRFTPDDHRMLRWSPEALGARLAQATELKNRINPSFSNLAAMAVQFVLAHEEVASAIVGCRTPAQVVSVSEALGGEIGLPVSELQFIYNTLP